MRRILLPALALATVAMVLWWTGGAFRPGGAPGEAAPATGDLESGALLRGHPSEEAATAPSPGPPRTAPPPPDWAHGTVTGRVVGPDGRPLRDSGAAALGVESLYGTPSFYRDAPAGTDGRFALHVKAGRPATVVAGAHRHGITVGPRVLLEEGETRDVGALRVVPEHRLATRVVSHAGDPVEDVEVYLASETDPQPEAWQSVYEASGLLGPLSTDADGRVAFDMLPAGTWRVSIDTGATASRDAVREHVRADGEIVVFVLPATVSPDDVSVQVRVLGPDGEPVPLCRIRLHANESSQYTWWEARNPDPVELECALGPVGLIVQEAFDADRRPLPYAPVTLPDVRGMKSPIVVRMERGNSIMGRVIWSGEPGTWNVEAYGWIDGDSGEYVPSGENGGALVSFRARTEAGGSFCIVGLPAGRFTLGAHGPGRLRGQAPVAESGATDVLVEMAPVGSVEVHVLAPRGLHFGTASLRLDQWIGVGLGSRGRWSGGEGERPDVRVFHARDLQLDGRYRLRAWGRCSGVDCPPVVLDDVIPREAPYVLQLVEGPHVRGVVEREDGTPIWGARVHYRPWPGGELDPFGPTDGRWLGFAATDATGAFDLNGVAEEVVLGVVGQGLVLRDAPPNVLPGTSGIRLVVVPERRISGRITDPGGGSLDGLGVVAVPDRGTPGLWTSARVTADGFFEVAGLAPGTYRVGVWVWDDRNRSDTRSVWSGPVEAGAHDLRLPVAPGAALEGVVRDDRELPLVGATIRLLGRWTNRAATTDRQGRYAFAGVPPGVDLELEVLTPRGRSILRPARATGGGAPTTLDVTLPER